MLLCFHPQEPQRHIPTAPAGFQNESWTPFKMAAAARWLKVGGRKQDLKVSAWPGSIFNPSASDRRHSSLRQTTCLTIRIQMFGFSNTSEYLNICLLLRPLKVSSEPQTQGFRCTKTPFKANRSSEASVETQLRFHGDGPAPDIWSAPGPTATRLVPSEPAVFLDPHVVPIASRPGPRGRRVYTGPPLLYGPRYDWVGARRSKA